MLFVSSPMSFQGASFRHNVNVMDMKEVKCMPWSCINSLGRHHCLFLPSSSQCKIGLARSCASGKTIRFVVNLGLNCEAPLFGQASELLSVRSCKVKKSDDTEGNLSGESIMLDEEILKRELQIAIEEEDYVQAAKIRDSLRMFEEDTRTSVLGANARFYDAFKHGDLAAMQGLWAKGDNVCCVHPGASGITGYDSVMESWEVVWMNYDFPLAIEVKDVRIHVRGNVGYVTCIEFVRTKGSSWGGQFVTNLFEKINGQWFICIHHASPIDL
ncbi:hypothetical protein Patl1_31749 [Pistacia atlantica]|uniref:Uncharacterized protein n=1 Tax=Pistacia atlantica TaxID=434234 RepID=A0ACC1APV3_9ROSI|nr:hypothetical protein Patl1_31749 [Pistacia atlantica]